MCRPRRTYRAGCVCPHDTSYRAAAKAAGPGAASLTHGFSLFLRKETLDFVPFRLESRIIFLHDLDAMVADFSPDFSIYLASSTYIDSEHPAVRAKAAALAAGAVGDAAIAARCFAFVRDEIAHSWDYQRNPVTCRASEVLQHGTGYCYAKSHLLAALLRANGIPAGLCYQRLAVGEVGPPFCLHGLNAVYLQAFGWYRIDARGNKPGVAAAFTPPQEQLAFPVLAPEERDLPEIWPAPLPQVVASLTGYATVQDVAAHLPDVEMLPLQK
jgi:transglutaminase-like putative cysteine protease